MKNNSRYMSALVLGQLLLLPALIAGQNCLLPVSAADKKLVAEATGAPVSVLVQDVSDKKIEKTADQKFDHLVNRYFDFCFEASPTWATAAGFHQYDKQLEDYSPETLGKTLATNKEFLERLSNIDFAKLNRSHQVDYLILRSFIKGQIFDYSEIRWLYKDPDRYSSLIADSVFGLAKRDFAPLQSRFESAISRMEQGPALLESGKLNLVPQETPKIYCEVALEQLGGTITLIKTTIPEAFDKVTDEGLKSRFKSAQEKLLVALEAYEKHLKEKVLPNTKKDFAIGEDFYAKKLLYDEMEDEKLSVILANGYKELHRLQRRFDTVAKEINPKLSAGKVFEEIAKEHPSNEALVSSTQACLDRLRQYCEKENICTIPSQDKVTVAESPSFYRALTFASMDTPGPYEDKAKEAFYYVTPAEKEWDPKRIEEHLRFFSYADIINTSVHEAYPGHYVQFLWVKHAPSKVRKLLGCSSNAEGWAHYCEEMMIEEGLTQKDSQGGKKEKDNKLALVQIHDALLRACRYIVGIEMHTRSMSFEDGVAFFEKQGHMEHANALRETKRGTKDPTYLVYTLGKLKILSLKDEYKRKAGSEYSLKGFHDSFLKCGFPPLKMVRAELLELPLSKD